jgi:hypothetical protein
MGVERGDFVAFGKGGLVEHGLEEIVETAAHGVDVLADVDQLGCAGADSVDPEDAAVVAVNVQFQKSGVVAQNVAAGDIPEPGDPGLIWNLLFRQFVFGRADHGKLWD